MKAIMKKILLLAIAMLPLVMAAQAKLGVVDSKAIYNLMPDKAAAEATLKASSEKYEAEFKIMQDLFNKKYADYQTVAADPTTPETIKERRVQELQESDRKIQEFQQTVAAELESQRNTLVNPILTKIQNAIEDVSLEDGLSIVFDTAKTPVAYTGPDIVDINAKVKERLGIK